MFAEFYRIPVQPENYPTALLPGINLEKGRERLTSAIKNIWGMAKERAQQVVDTVRENRSLALVGMGVAVRMAASAVSDGDMHSVDMLTKTAFSAGIFVDKAVIPLAEKLTGVEVDKHPLLSKVRGTLRDLTAISGGMALAGLAEGAFNPGTVFAEEPKQSQPEGITVTKEPVDPSGDSFFGRLFTNGKNFFHSGGVVFPNGSVLFENSGSILPSEPLPLDGPDYSTDPDLSITRASKSLEEFTSQKNVSEIIPGTGRLKIPDNIIGYVDLKNIDNTPDSVLQRAVDSTSNFSADQFIEPTGLENTKAGPVGVDSFTVERVSIDPAWSGLVENGESKIHSLMEKMGVEGEIDHNALTRKLQQGIRAYETGNLLDDSPIGRLFHVSNGTESLIALQKDPRFIGELLQQGILTR